jgi:fucose permease
MTNQQATTKAASGGRIQLLILLLLNYFTFALVTNITGPLFPYWKEQFNLSNFSTSLLGSAFFLAYGLTSLPQGYLLEIIGSKKTFVWGSALILLGSLAFALNPTYEFGLMSVFFIGIGVTALQIVGNLLVKKIDDDPNKYSKNLTLAQVFCGIGGLGGGFLINYLVKNLNLEWSYCYYIFAGLAAVLTIFALITFIPEDNSAKPENKANASTTLADYLTLLKNPLMIIFAMGIFVYVGIEVGVANFISEFLKTSHNMEPTQGGNFVVPMYWLAQSVGRFSGGYVLNYLDAPKALIVYSAACLASLLFALLIPSAVLSCVGFIAVGFFTSIMFPSIFSLAVNQFGIKNEPYVAGILCTAIIGGSVTQLLIGWFSDVSKSLPLSLTVMGVISFLYIAFIGFTAKKSGDSNNSQNNSNNSLEGADNKSKTFA